MGKTPPIVMYDKMKKKSWPTTSNYIEVTSNLYCAPGALWQNYKIDLIKLGN